MQAKVWKEARRVLAVFMAFAMVVTNFSSIPVKADEGSGSIDVLNVSEMEAETITAPKTVGAFTINATESKSVVIDASSKSADNFSFTQRLKFGGTGSVEARNIAYTATGAATMTVYAMSSSSSADRDLVLDNGSGTVSTQKALGASLTKLTYEISAAGTYYLYSANSGINIYYVAVEYAAGSTESSEETPTPSESESESESETESESESETTTDTESSEDSTEAPVTEIEGTKTVYDFRDGSIIPTDTDGKGTVSSLDGKLTVACGPSNAYRYSDTQHGVEFKTGNTVTIAVPEKAQIWIGGCQYSAENATVAFSMGETALKAINTKTATCYHQDAAAVVYTYEGEAGNLVLTFENSTYVPVITVIRAESQQDNNENQGTQTTVKTTSTYDFRDGSIVPTDTDGKATVTSLDGKLTVACGTQNAYKYNDASHGVAFKTGNTITIKVPEKAVVKIGGCQYSGSDASVTFSMGGTELESIVTKTEKCYHQDETVVTYEYTGEVGDLVLTFTGQTYVPVIVVEREETKTVEMIEVTTDYDFRDGSIVPTDTDGKATVTSPDGKLTVACGTQNAYKYNDASHGVAFKTGNTITIKVPEKAVVKIGGCQYSGSDAMVTFSTYNTESQPIYTKTEKCYHQDGTVITHNHIGEAGDLVLTFTGQTYVPIITVVRTEPKPEKTEVTANVTIKDTNNLLGSSKVLFVNKADATDVVDATNGGAVTVKVNATYDIKTDNADISAKNGTQAAFATGTEDINLEITIAATVIKPVVTIVDADKVLGDATLTLTNSADATDAVALTNGATAKLKIGASYLLSCSSASVTATIAGSKVFKAAPDVTAIQVDVVETDITNHTVDVWDFGAEQLANTDTVTYNNKLTVDIINSWFPGVAAGTKGVPLAGFEVKDADGNVELAFVDGGYTTTHRLRTTNTALSRHDEKSLKDLEDKNIVYSGYLYSNKSASADVYVKVVAKAGDIFTFVVSSNGASSDITWTAPSGEKEVQVYDSGSSNAQRMTFYAKEDGFYTLHSATEKLVVARIYRERPDVVTVSGSVTAPAGAPINGATLLFTNQTTGAVSKATIADGKYEVSLSEQYKYAMKLDGAYGYIVDENNTFAIKNEEGNKTVNVNVIAVDLAEVSGSLADLTAADAKNLKLEFISDKVFVPEVTIDAEKATYVATLEKGVTYVVKESGVEDYTLVTTTAKVDAAGTLDIKFTKKPVYDVTVEVEGVSETAAAGIKFTFTRLNEAFVADGYVYTFTGTEGIALRDGQYQVKAELTGYNQGVTADVKVKGAAQTITVVMKDKKAGEVVVPYKAEITVGTSGDYKTIGEALDAVRHMTRDNGERVVIAIEPGNYEEMLVIDVENVTLKNVSATPSIELANKGVDIDENAVRITSYYGHGYTYYSMGSDCKYDEELLKANKANGYPSFENPGSGTTAGSYWNATVVVTASGFEADGIIFENSFNQYVSEKAAADVIVKQSGAKEGTTARASMKAGDVTVQNKAYVERAAALAIYNNINDVVFDNCKFVGRQDTLYGGTNSYVEFNECSIYGGTDYIFGGMIAIFNKCDLVFNTSEDKNDVGYITAAQQKSGRGYLMYECHITSTTPGVDTASEYTSKPGYLGRPWQADTSEVVFYNTTIDAADAHWNGGSLIQPVGWNNTLSGESAGMYEYGTVEKSGVDNSASRADWATLLTSAKLNDGTEIMLDAFRREVEEETPSAKTEFTLDTTADLKAFAQGTKADGDSEKAGTDGYFTLLYSAKTKVDSSSKTFDDGYAASQRVNFGDKVSTEKNAIKFTTSNAATVKVWWVEGGDDNRQITILDSTGKAVATTEVTLAKNATCISTFELAEAGTYYLGSTPKNNYIFKVVVTEVPPAEPIVSTLDTTTDLKAFAQGTKADGDSEKAGTDNYFTLLYSTKTKVDGSNKTFDDGYAASQRVNFGDKVSTEKNAIKFTTSNAATVKVWWVEGGDDNRQITILDATGKAVATTEVTLEKNATCISTFELAEAGTYYLGSTPKNNYFFKVEVTETPGGAVEKPRADWSTVAAPVITEVALDAEDENVINVTVNANVGHDGADKLTVVMTDASGKEIATRNSSAEKEEHTVSFEPESSGVYTFTAKILRENEEDKAAAETKTYNFVLPLVAPNIKGVYNVGEGNVDVEWDAVKEAEKYIVSVEGTDISIETTALMTTIEGLEAGKTYTIKVVAVRGNDTVEASVSKEVKDEVEIKWYFSAYGSSTNTSSNGYELLDDGSIRVYSTGGKGKIVPGSTDGIAYYYTLIDPATTNFTLTATAVVNNWTLSNGQEGFGIMAADRVGKHGDGTAFWNNSYQAIVSKVEYYYDNDLGKVTDDSSYGKVTMKLGVGSLEKVGVTADNLAEFNANNTAVINEQFKSTTKTLEDSCGKQFGSGTFNLVGNYKGTEPTGTVENPLTEFTFTIQKNNTGYFVSYTDAAGQTVTQKYYDTEALSQIVDESVAIGFFASRNADITFKDISFTTIASEKDAPAEERPVTLVTPIASVTSGTVANSAEYELTYYANFDGTITINGASGVIVNNAAVEANRKYSVNVPLNFGNNNFAVVATPNANYVPSEFEKLSSYEPISFTHTVNYKAYGEAGETLYVAPNGSASGNGTESNPLDIYTAVKYAQPGQTIILKEGTYKLRSTVKVERGIDGTEENRINMIADPNATTRPVFDFQGICAGMVLAGDYWYFQGFDVTNSADAQKGIQVSGNYNVLDQIHAYKNGNTGIQISRYLGTDEYADWPAHNLILNCTSWENADKGYEDADGFAAKLTVGDGNVFDGCVAHHNADDGWDLFAKVQTGSIGSVTIKNSVAYKNGYVFDESGNEINAGNGNGFKMGGDSMTGGHILENSIAFDNKAKGIDSNSCPDIKVYNSIAFNNGSYNVAFYTNTAANTDYEASGIISYRTENLGQAEQLKLAGTQDTKKVYGETNYYWDATYQISVNNNGDVVRTDWFKSLEFTGIIRNEDGTINMNGFLELTENAKVDASLGGSGSTEITPGEPTDGTITDTSKPSSGSSGSGSTGGGSYDDDEEEEDSVIEDIVDTIVNVITGGNKDKDKEKEEATEEVKVPEGTDELVKDLVAEILSGESVGTAVSEETAEKIAEAIKEGKTIVTETVTTVLEASQVPAEEKDAIEAFISNMTDKECGIAQYLDLSVLIGTTEGDTLGNYHETAKSIEFTIDIPSDMLAEGRTFFVVRIHNGETDVLETKDNGDGTITFKTNKFSTYAIAYIDGEVENLPVVDDNAPVVDEQPVVNDVVEESGSSMGMIAVIAVLLLAVGSFLIIKRKKASEQDGLN